MAGQMGRGNPGADIDANDDLDGASPLHLAARSCSNTNNHQQKDSVYDLLERGANSNVQDKKGNTPLHDAAKGGHLQNCRSLIESGNARVSTKNHKCVTPLHYAAQEGHSEIVEFLIGKGADPNHRNKHKDLPLHSAAMKGHHRCCAVLAQYYQETEEDDHDTPIMLAAGRGYTYCLDVLFTFTTCVNVNHINSKGNTALHVAVSVKGDFDKTVSKLVSMGADLNIQNKLGNTPLMEAITRNNIRCVDTLIEAKAEMSLRNNRSQSVLHLAASVNGVECMKSLLKIEVSQEVINAVDYEGMTALAIAVHRKRKRCTSMLLEYGASRTAGDIRRQLLLHKAIERRPSPFSSEAQFLTGETLLNLVLNKELDVNMKDSSRNSPLQVAAQNGYYNACKRLLQYSARVNDTDLRGRTALHMAAENGHSTILMLLIKSMAKLEATDYDKCTALHIAAAKGNLECCQVLVRSGKHLAKRKNVKNEYPLTVAFNSKHHNVFKFLLDTYPCNIVSKLPNDLSSFLHSETSNLLNQTDDTKYNPCLQVIIESKWWRQGMGLYTTHKEEKSGSNFKKMIKSYPHLAERVMSHCVMEAGGQDDFHILEDKVYTMEGFGGTVSKNDPSAKRPNPHHGQREEHDPGIAFPGVEEGSKNSEHPVGLMINFNRRTLLQHPLTTRWLQRKWMSSTRFLFMLLLLQRSISIVILILSILFLRNWHHMEDQLEMTREEVCWDEGTKALLEEYYYSYSVFLHVVLFLIFTIHLAFEINGFHKMHWAYANVNFFIVRLPFLILCFILLLPLNSCEFNTGIKDVTQWQCGIIALIIQWFDLLYNFNSLLRHNIFYVINAHFLKSYMKGTLFVVVVIAVFAFAFHVLLPSQAAFATFPRAIVKTVVWLRGDLAYDDTFLNQSLDYPIMANILFLIFSCVVGVFILTLLKSPSTDKKELRVYQKVSRAHLILMFDMCFPCCKIDCCDPNNNSNTNYITLCINVFNKMTNPATPLLSKLSIMGGRSEKHNNISEQDSDDDEFCQEDSELDHLVQLNSRVKENTEKLDKLLEVCNSIYLERHLGQDSVSEGC
ncbi:hypothetical protein Pmani_026369 [Petrolisthes manimaculis]|uniref:Transient receptor potential cation channel subfamily A member 1 n=1 Tax=Petrolisthes manimaculis TaxID=1843537 RepID=A0AAE1P5H3_9EUCA|nr:hypothetical protein Pmani_026369 [Petrolisthes manimaculis]